MTLNSVRRGTALAALAAAVLAAGPTPAASADSGNGTPHYVRIAGLFGESDEEKAARLAAQQREQAQDAAISQLTDQVSELQRTLRDVTGQIEEARHQNLLLKEQIAKMQKDFEYRMCQLSAQALGAGSSGTPAMDCSAYGGSNGAAPVSSSGSVPPAGGGAENGQMMGSGQGGMQMGRPSGTLGTLPAGTSLPGGRQDVTVDMSSVGHNAAASGGGGQYKTAMDLLAKGRYSEAGAAFQAFADANPDSPKAPQAVYWVGSVAFVQKDYPSAARAFAEEIKKYPDAEMAPQSMLRLGQSLIAMKQKQEGCSALAAIRAKYPHASASIREEAAKARKDAECR